MDERSPAQRRNRTDDECLARLEERYRHELLDDEVRQELRDELRALKRTIGRIRETS